ncbi:MAG: hypothetical protein FVQ81_07375 [Candidatus Glassbacteria bacterium]|nr:hypothetical protein [Candidatus Glassbacteria bacterium]
MADRPLAESWTGRKRILTAFDHQPTDRVPRFDQTVTMEVASAVMGREALVGGGTLRFREVEATFRGPDSAEEFADRMIGDVTEFYLKLGYDMARLPWRDRRKASARLDEFTYLFGDADKQGPWEIYRYDPASSNWHQADSWLAGGNVEALTAHLEREAESWSGPDTDPGRLDDIRRFKAGLPDDIALCATVAYLGIPMWDAAWLMALELAPALVEADLEHQLEQGLADIELASSLDVDVVLAGGDFCTKNGPAFSPAVFDSMFLPRLRKLTGHCERHGMYYVFRTDGDTWPVAESLFGRSGVHGYGEIDYGAGMRLGKLRREYPDLTLFGNLDCGGALIFGGEEDVRRTVREILDETGGLGHVAGSSNAVMPETPPRNYLAMLDEIDRYEPGASR